MLERARVEAILPVSDRPAAVAYWERLGLRLVAELPEEDVLEGSDGSRLVVYESRGAGASRHTLVGFAVDDIEAAVDELRLLGIVLEEYDLPEVKTVDGIAALGASRAAWFRDPDGNIVGVWSRG